MNKKNNQRFLETQNKLKIIMMKLMLEKNFEDITVTDICKQANVNRSTFYIHFVDIYDLAEKIDERLDNKLIERFKDIKCDTLPLFENELFMGILKLIRENKSFYKGMLSNKDKIFPLKNAFNCIWEYIIEPQCKKSFYSEEWQIKYYKDFYQSGFLTIMYNWVKNDCTETDKDISRVMWNCMATIWTKN